MAVAGSHLRPHTRASIAPIANVELRAAQPPGLASIRTGGAALWRLLPHSRRRRGACPRERKSGRACSTPSAHRQRSRRRSCTRRETPSSRGRCPEMRSRRAYTRIAREVQSHARTPPIFPRDPRFRRLLRSGCPSWHDGRRHWREPRAVSVARRSAGVSSWKCERTISGTSARIHVVYS